MAVHLREFSKCAVIALARQLQVCARFAPSHQCQSNPTSSLVSVRGVASSACCNNGGTPKDSIAIGGKNTAGTQIKDAPGKSVGRDNVEKVRIKYQEPTDATTYSRVLAEATRGILTSSGKERAAATGVGNRLGSETLRTSPLSELIDQQVGLRAKRLMPDDKLLNSKAGCSPLTSETAPTGKYGQGNTTNHFHPHRKESLNVGEPRAGKFQKKKSQRRKTELISVTDPMSKLAKDINQWFNEVMEHLAKTNATAVSSRGKNTQPLFLGKSQQRSKKSKSAKSCKKIAAIKRVGPTHHKPGSNGNPPIFSHDNRFESKQKGLASYKPTLNTKEPKSSLAKPSMSSKNDDATPSNAGKRLKLQLSALNDEMSAKIGERINQRSGDDATGINGTPGVSAGRDASKMLEIKPSLVENTERAEEYLASTAGWWPYGAPRGNLPEIPSDNSKETNSCENHSKLNTSLPSSDAYAAASQAISRTSSTKHKMVTMISPGENKVKPSVSNKGCSLEKGKGFILLNTKEKERERQAWLERKKEKEAFRSKANTGFILVDPEKPTTKPPIRSSNNNTLLLDDNPHIAAAERLKSSEDPKKQEAAAKKVSTGETTMNSERLINTMRSDKMDTPSSEGKTTTEIRNEGTVSPIINHDTRQWADMVNQKLSEIMKSKLVDSEKDITETSAFKTTAMHQDVAQRAKCENTRTKPAEIINESGNEPVVEASPDVGQKKDFEVEKVKPSTSEWQDYGSDKRNTSDYLQDEDIDREYERRIGELINGSMGYEDAGDSSTTSRLFGPLTLNQHTALEKILETGETAAVPNHSDVGYNDKTSTEQNQHIVSHPYLHRNSQTRPVSVNELRPVVKSGPERKNTKKDLRKDSEPRLCVKPEEIVNARKSTGSAHSSMISDETPHVIVVQDLDRSKFSKNGEAPNETQKGSINPAIGPQELWLSMLQSRTDVFQVLGKSEMEKRETFLKTDGPPSRAGSSEPGSEQKSRNDNSKTRTSQKAPHSTKDEMNLKSHCSGMNSDAQIESSQILISRGLEDKKAPSIFQEEFLKIQQEKLKRSLDTNAQLKSLRHNAQKQSNTAEVDMTNLLVAAKNKEDMANHGDTQASGTDELNRIKDGGTRGKGKCTAAPCKVPINENEMQKQTILRADLNLLEAREQPKKDLDSIGSSDEITDTKTNCEKRIKKTESRQSASIENVLVKRSPKKNTKKKKSSRFKQQPPLPELAQSVYRDIRATHAQAKPTSGSFDSGVTCQSTRQPLGNLSQSDQIYNMIKESVPEPLSRFDPAYMTSPLTRRSRVLTQAGLGTITSSKTGLVDPARLPKLGNLFGSFDGFIAMDAVPVLDGKAAKTVALKTSSAEDDVSAAQKPNDSQLSGDELYDNDLRASLAKKREAASAAARRKLIEEYEKNIANHERGLEIYRSKLRRVRQAMAEPEISKPRSDNPRRQSDS